MTERDMNTLGFYRESPKVHPNLWRHENNEWELNVPFLKGLDYSLLLQHIYEIGVINGVEKGKQLKLIEIKTVLQVQ